MKTIHTIFGAGQVGVLLAQELATDDNEVRLVRRSPAGAALSGVTWMQADATRREEADAACRGADVVYNCTNPPDYHRWDGVLAPLFNGVRGAATRAGARLVVLDNLYMYGQPAAAPFDESTPLAPCSHKGELRRQLVEELFAAHERGELEVTSGRASDFFGPSTPNAAVFHDRFFTQLAAGRPVEVWGDPDQPHSYSFTPDVARGLAVLGTRPEAAGRAWHLPVASQLSTRAIVERFAATLGGHANLRVVPKWLLHAVGWVVPLVRAIAEMSYQWDAPFVVDDGAFRKTFGAAATPLDEAIAATLASHGLPASSIRAA